MQADGKLRELVIRPHEFFFPDLLINYLSDYILTSLNGSGDSSSS